MRFADAKSATVFLSLLVVVNAALLFIVEPMFAKLVLPLLGGTPSVWNTCLVFFQAALLIGYGYAHALMRIRDPRRRAVVHAILLGSSFLALPLAIRASGDPPPGGASIIWLLWLLTLSLGAPFVMLSSGGPLIQRVLADSGHPDSSNPYFLYAASNFGSLAAVASYPLLIEPWLTLSAQRVAWSAAYVALAVAIAGTFITIAWRSPRARIDAAPSEPRSITSRRRAAWVLYSAVPAGLLVAVTTYITTDLAAVPLLWILPLMLYLLSFIIVFSRRPLIRHPWMTRAGPQVLVVIAIPLFWGLRLPGVIGIAAHLVVLFVIAMICHGELARQRPPPLQLTEFFVWVAVGGLVGGTFTALLAPLVFDRVYEYPILLALAGALLPSSVRQRINAADVLLPTGIGAAALLLTRDSPPLPSPWALVITLLLGVAIFSFRKRSFRFGIALAAIFAVGELRDALGAGGNTVLDAERSYFGVYRVARNSGAEFVTLYHGTTLHGAQSVDRAKRLVPLTYYHPRGPAGDVFLRTPPGMKAGRVVGVVGLGTGSLACYGRRDEHWTYYEIDPLVARIALDPDLFTFLRDCSPPVRVVFGDARLTLAKTRLAKYDILILDAFSSDAIPVHLLTREAFRLYFALLAPHGVLAVHISNEHLDLEPVIAAVARDLALVSMVRRDFAVPDSDVAEGRRSSVWAVLARSPADLGVLSGSREWRPLRPRGDVAVWTDDFSNIVRVFDWR